MQKLRDLATRSDFQIGPLCVSPSRRRVSGPTGELHVEPLVMQVFLLLIDAGGRVVSRDELFDQCWGGTIVGDDSLNRVIAKVRRIAEVAPGLFELETIPRTGYRLTGNIVDLLRPSEAAVDEGSGMNAISRRVVLAGGAATVALASGAGLWWASRRRASRFDALMARGDEAFRNGFAFSGANEELVRLYEEAVQLEPANARAWGLLAYFRSAGLETVSSEESNQRIEAAQSAARRALAINRQEPNALVAMLTLEGSMIDLTTRDRRLRSILSIDPANMPAMAQLMPLLQAAGLTRESWGWNERILRLSPFSQPHLCVRAMKLWILGKVVEADRVIDRVRGLWPDFGYGYYVRFIIFALTDRARAALALLDSVPRDSTIASLAPVWRLALNALDSGSPESIEAARRACIDAARQSAESVNTMVMLLGALGQTEAAFEVTDGYLLWRGQIVTANQADGRLVDAYSRRMTQWLFTPPLAQMRANPRFLKLCEEFGLAAYWRARRVKPDYLVYG